MTTNSILRQTRFDIASICLRRSSGLIVAGWSAFCILGIYGLAKQDVSAGRLAGLVDRLLSQGFSLLLAGTLISAFVVTEEDRWQSFSQSLRISGGRRQLIASKLLTAVAVGMVVGVYAIVLALATTAVVCHSKSVPMHLGSGSLETLGGVGLVCVAASVVGLAFGLIFRTTTAALIVILFGRLGLEEGLLATFPKVGKWTFAGAQASVYRDSSTEHLAFGPGLALMVAWMLVLLAIGRRFFMGRDLV